MSNGARASGETKLGPSKDQAGAHLGHLPSGGHRYVVTRSLGRGAQGHTLEAIDKASGDLVAIKRFQVRGAASWKDFELAEREARVLAQLSHPSLPRYLDHFEEDGALLLVMSLVPGQDLEARREQGAALETRQVLELLRAIGDVLRYLRGKAPPVIHRDIKPRNIIQRDDGGFSLVDFGSVRDRLKEDGSTIAGTYGYMAPEQFQGRALPVSDVYGLGATALVLLTGVSPEDQPHQGLAIDVRRALGAGADPRLVQLLSWMLTPDPDQRLVDVPQGIEQLFGPPEAEPPKPEEAAEAKGPQEAKPRRERSKRSAKTKAKTSARRTAERHASGELSDRFRLRFSLGGLLVGLVLTVLVAARVANFALLRVSLPLLLGFLFTFISLVFRRKMPRASEGLRDAAERGDRQLRRAALRVRRRARDAARGTARGDRTAPTRVRVVDTEAEPMDDEGEETAPGARAVK
ncbi:MAG: serine/threonine protein kinase [Polyangiaceae bacterium]|nr:serine/threonine protein kinase [Polyangiaceae bacterium]MCW5789474.1 serine/threonine protein kinase [Polyangiaceae bacterium]